MSRFAWCPESVVSDECVGEDQEFSEDCASAIATLLDNGFSLHTAEQGDGALRGYDSVAAWFDEKGWSFPTVLDDDASLRTALKIRWTPTYLVIAPDRSVQGFRSGLADAGDHAVKDFVRDIAKTRQDWSGS